MMQLWNSRLCLLVGFQKWGRKTLSLVLLLVLLRLLCALQKFLLLLLHRISREQTQKDQPWRIRKPLHPSRRRSELFLEISQMLASMQLNLRLLKVFLCFFTRFLASCEVKHASPEHKVLPFSGQKHQAGEGISGEYFPVDIYCYFRSHRSSVRDRCKSRSCISYSRKPVSLQRHRWHSW